LLTALVKLSSLIRRDARFEREYDVGESVLSAVEAFEPELRSQRLGGAGLTWEDERRLKIGRTAQVFKARGWPDLAVLWQRESEAALSFSQMFNRKSEPSMVLVEVWVPMIVAATQVGFEGLRLAVVLLALAGLASLLLRAKTLQHAAVPPLSWPARIIQAILALIPWYFVVLTYAVGSLLDFPWSSPASVGIQPVTPSTVLAVGLWFLLIAIVVWQFRRMSGTGRIRTQVAGLLLVLSLIAGTAGMLSNLLAIEPPSYPGLSWANAILGVVLLVFVCGRIPLLRIGVQPPRAAACALHTARQSLGLLAKVLLVAYFVILLGQLPFRIQAAEHLHAIAVNEVQAVLSAQGSSAGGLGD